MSDLERFLRAVDAPGATWAGLREVRETTTTRHVRDAKPERNHEQVSHGVMVEVLVDGAFGWAATSRVDEPGIRDASARAASLARVASQSPVRAFDAAARPKSVGTYRSPDDPVRSAWTPADVNELLVRIAKRLRVSDEIVRTTATLRTVDTVSRMVSTAGTDVTQTFSHVTTDFAATAQRGSLVQRRSDGGWLARSRQGSLAVLETGELLERADVVAREVLELLDAEPCPDETTTLLLGGDQMMLQIHESIGHPLELDRILGDERNYAGTSFVRLEDFGALRYGSELLTVSWDPTVRGELASYAFDDVGQRAERELLIDRGVLVRGLGGLESQARAGVPGVATQRSCSWNRPPIDRMANLNLEPGDASEEDLVASVERGVYMRANRSWSIDDRRQKFQFGCEHARLIEDGKLTKTLRDPNYRGETLSFWSKLSKVGRADTVGVYGTPFCGKGEPNQAIRVGHASPTCRFDGVEVFGGAS